jgi:tetratricopeptide (TPR) repeat protein
MFSRFAPRCFRSTLALVLVLSAAVLAAGGCSSPAYKFNEAGLAAYQAGDYSKARSGFEEAIAEDPDIGEYYFNLAVCEQALGHYDQAIAKYDMAANLQPNLWRAFENKAQCYIEKGDFAKAEEALIAGTKANPLVGDIFISTGRFYAGRGDAYNAKLWMAKAVAADPDNPATHREYGFVLAQAGEREKAAAELQKSLDLNPLQPDVSAKLSEVSPRGSMLPPPKPQTK